MSVVYVKQTCAVGIEGDILNLTRGQAWDSSSPVVRDNPGLFEAEPVKVLGRHGVERATRAPGEKRAASSRKPAANTAPEGEEPEGAQP